MARCSLNDAFVKATGRKLALARAMAAAGLPREQRGALWRSYLTQTGVLPNAFVAPEKEV